MASNKEFSLPREPRILQGTLPLILGGAGFSFQLHTNPQDLPIRQIISKAFELGIRTIDTSPYYEPSEQLMGEALNHPEITSRWPRSSYTLMTKVGRVTEKQFDYSPEWIRKSVLRSLERFHTSYVDVVFCHDVEFISIDEAVAAVGVLFDLVQLGQIKYVGISGYKIDILVLIAHLVQSRYGRAVDVVQTWGQLTLQNTNLLSKGLDAFEEAGITTVCASSPLAVGLLRAGGLPVGSTGDWHPAPSGLRQAAQHAAAWTAMYGHSLSSVAMRFAVGLACQASRSNLEVTTITGISKMSDLDDNVRDTEAALRHRSPSSENGSFSADGAKEHEKGEQGLTVDDKFLFDGVRKILEPWLDYDFSTS